MGILRTLYSKLGESCVEISTASPSTAASVQVVRENLRHHFSCPCATTHGCPAATQMLQIIVEKRRAAQ